MAKETKILIITEGDKDEILMNRLKELYIPDSTSLYCYHTNIYDLYQRLEQELDGDFTDMDVLLTLKSYERRKGNADGEIIKILEATYSDILLIFDFDPQDHQYSADKLRTLMEVFNNSTENGQLYLSYPMIESFLHLKLANKSDGMLDEQFLRATFSAEELAGHRYKKRANQEGMNLHIKQASKMQLDQIIYHHLYKMMNILDRDTSYGNIMEWRRVARDSSIKELFENEHSLFEKTKHGDVISTCWHFIEESYPASLFTTMDAMTAYEIDK